jgi:hypothetical protein
MGTDFVQGFRSNIVLHGSKSSAGYSGKGVVQDYMAPAVVQGNWSTGVVHG